jgi:hypothetical protein
MRSIRTILLITFLLPFFPLKAADAPAASYDAMVVVSISDFDDAALTRLTSQVGKDKSTTIEYACTWSGVVVLKLSDISVGERADVITLVRRQLGSAGLEKGVEFVHVHVEARGVGKC